jgi:hypothetical protein
MRRYVGAMVVAVAMVVVVGTAGVSKAQAAPGFFNFSIGNSGYGPAGYSASFGSYAPPVPYYAARPGCGPVPYYGGYRGYGHHGHHGYRGW